MVVTPGCGCKGTTNTVRRSQSHKYIENKIFQGRPFYAVQGRALCEGDYLDTLEKCCVCGDPILDRILRATGKPYHPRCFTCVVCQKSLDGIPFTVDAVNRIHCIEDFHKRYDTFLFLESMTCCFFLSVRIE